jgi:type I restriction enzyme S subunit
MSDWAETTLGEVMALDIDAVEVEPATSYEIVGVLNRGRGLLYRGPINGTETSYKTLNRIAPGQVVYSRLKAFEGAITVTPASLGNAYASQEFPTFTCGERLIPDYFALLTTTPRLWDFMQNLSTGMGGRRERVKPKDFLTIKMSLPPLAAQQRVVDVMAAVDAHIEPLADELGSTLALRRSLIHPYEDATEVSIGDVASVSQGKALPKAVQGQRSGDVSWFKIADMTGRSNEDGYTVADTRLSADQIASLGGVILPVGAVVFPRVGAAVLTEKKRLLDVPGAVDENHLVLKPNDGISSEYLLTVVEAIRLGDLVQTGAVPSLNMGLIRSAKVLWSCEGNDIAGPALGHLRALARELRDELIALRSFRATLLSLLLNKEIEVPDSFDRMREPDTAGVD